MYNVILIIIGYLTVGIKSKTPEPHPGAQVSLMSAIAVVDRVWSILNWGQKYK